MLRILDHKKLLTYTLYVNLFLLTFNMLIFVYNNFEYSSKYVFFIHANLFIETFFLTLIYFFPKEVKKLRVIHNYIVLSKGFFWIGIVFANDIKFPNDLNNIYYVELLYLGLTIQIIISMFITIIYNTEKDTTFPVILMYVYMSCYLTCLAYMI